MTPSSPRRLPSPRSASLLLAGSLLVAACAPPDDVLPTFHGPERSAVLHPDDGSPFEEPVGFVANTRSGTIVPLDLKHSVELGDSVASPFLRPRWVATGDTRQLGAVSAWSPDGEAVTVFVADLSHDLLVEAPYLTGLDDNGVPVVYEATSDEGVFLDVDGSGDSAALSGLTLRRGFTTTETWSIEFNGEEWWVFGSRSGKQGLPAYTGVPYSSDNREVEFTIDGTASAGDRIELQTDVGIVEHDLGGSVLELARIPGEDLLLLGTWSAATDLGELVVWDMAGAVEVGRVPLPEGAQPWRFAWTDDGTELFVADSQRSAVYDIVLDLAAPELSTVVELPTDGPVAAVAWVGDEGHVLESAEDDGYEHLFVALAEANRVDLFDLRSDTWIDVNPLDDHFGGIEVQSPVTGLAGTPVRFKLQETTNWDVRQEAKVVAVTTFNGDLRMIEADTGCFALEEGGASVAADAGSDALEFSDRGNTSDPLLWEDPATGERIVFSSCGGVAKAETWTMTYDELDASWRVEGNVTGELDNRVREDERYVSDHGEFSLLILSGTNPSSDGDTFVFRVDDGQLRIDEVRKPGSQISSGFELPGPPVVFQYEAGPTGGGWDEVDRRTFVLLPVTNSDLAVRVRLQAWAIEAIWE